LVRPRVTVRRTFLLKGCRRAGRNGYVLLGCLIAALMTNDRNY